jgi:sister chromatid cohesion protein PDS5
MLLSPDDKVRLAAVKVFGTLSYNLLLSRIGKQSLESLGERCKDRKNTIRIEAMQVLARMWNLAYHDMYPQIVASSDHSASGQVAATETFSWIPSALVSTRYTNDRDLLSTLYKVLYTVLVPLSITDDMLRTRRLLLFTSQLHEERTRTAFQSLPGCQAQGERYLSAYIDAAEKYNGGVVESGKDEAAKRLDNLCAAIATLIGMDDGYTPRKTDLKKWAEGNDRRGFKLFRDLIDPAKDFKTLRKTQVGLIILN